MDFSKLRTFNKIYPLFIEKYETFTDDSASITDKINSVIQALNKVGKLSNDVIKDWNRVMDWVMNEGLGESVEKKVDELIESGRFQPLLDAMFDVINEKVDGFETQLADIVTNVKKYFTTGDVDYTTAIRNAYDATPDFGTLYLPAGWYQFSDTLTFNRPVHLKFDGNIEYKGTRDKTTILIDSLTNINISFGIIKDVSVSRTTLYDGWHGWVNDSYIGVVLRNLKDCNISIKNVLDFNIGVRCLADAGKGFWFNRIKINSLSNNRIQLDLCNNDVGSWMNGNNFYDTAFNYSGSGLGFTAGTFDRILINQTLINNTYNNNTARFTDFKFETHQTFGGTYTAIKLKKASGFVFDNYRNELLGDNSVFCVLDVGLTTSGDVKFCIDKVVFNPTFIVPGCNSTVTILNADLGKNSYSDIYTFLPQPNKYMMFDEKELNKNYRFVNSNKHSVKNIFRKDLSSTDLSETLTDSSSSDKSLVNGISVTGSYPLVFYITNVSLGDEISVEVGIADSTQTPNVQYKIWDKSNVFCVGGLIGTTKTISHKGYWDNTYNIEKQSTANTIDKFTVNHSNVGTVAILVSGGVKSIRVYSTNRNNVPKKTNIAKIEKIDGFVANATPTRTTDGYFKPDDILYYYDGTNVTQYKLVYNAGSLTWNNQGTINL